MRRLLWMAVAVWGVALNEGTAQTTQVDLNNQGKNINFSQAASTRPSKTGTTLPAACALSETFIKSDAAAGANLYICTATDVWTAQGGGGSGSTPLGGVNAQTGTAYTVQTGDLGKLVTHANASAIAATLPQATSGFAPAGWYFDAENRGPGTLTITPVVSTIDGGPSLALLQHQGVRIFSDGANYFTQRGFGGYSPGAGITMAGSQIVADTAVVLSRPTHQAGTDLYCSGTGGTDAYTCALTPALTAYTPGQFFIFRPDVNNTAAASLNIDSLGAVNFKKLAGGAKVDLATGDLDVDGRYLIVYDGLDFLL